MKAEYCLSEHDAGMCGFHFFASSTPHPPWRFDSSLRAGVVSLHLPSCISFSLQSLLFATLMPTFSTPSPFPLIPSTFHTYSLLTTTPPKAHCLQTCLLTCIPLSPAGFLSLPFKVLWRKPAQAKQECKALRLSV